MRSRACTVCFAALASVLWTPGAAAQTRMVKQRLPDGTVMYSDHAAAGAKVEAYLESPRPQAPVAASQVGPVGLALPGSQMLTLPPLPTLPLPGATAVRASASERAKKELVDAMANQAAGAIPQEGDRVHSANGKLRFSDAYLKRQSDLAKAVESAKSAVRAEE